MVVRWGTLVQGWLLFPNMLFSKIFDIFLYLSEINFCLWNSPKFLDFGHVWKSNFQASLTDFDSVFPTKQGKAYNFGFEAENPDNLRFEAYN
jgi:hypothetical protein